MDTMIRRVGRGIRHEMRADWLILRHEWRTTMGNARAFLSHPPRWFVIASAICAVLFVTFWACALTGAVREQAIYLRSLMP